MRFAGVGRTGHADDPPEVTAGVVVVVVGDELPVLPVVPVVPDDELPDVAVPPEPDEVTVVPRGTGSAPPCCRRRGGRWRRRSRSLPQPPWRK